METYRRICRECGKEFETTDAGTWGCSPRCRSFLASAEIARKRESERARVRGYVEKDEMPGFDLEANPAARVEWVMGLPEADRAKYMAGFTRWEKEAALRMEKRRMLNDRREAGYFVKGSKADEAAEEGDDGDERSAQFNSSGTDDTMD